MSTLDDARRDNGRRLIQQHGASKIADLLGHASASTLSQIFGPNPTRQPTEKFVRRMEQVLDLEAGSMDKSDVVKQPVPAIGADTVAAVIRLVGQLAESEEVLLSPRRFADVAALAYTDSLEHGGIPREAHIRQVVRLFK
jgi:hypothetical protein